MPDNSTSHAPSDEALPPVQPPSAGFLVQLFLIPGLIVGLICLVFFSLKLLVPEGDVRKEIERLRSHGEGRWQAAHNLASVLPRQENDQLRRDPAVAKDLAQFLSDEIAAGSMDGESLKLRYYLCVTLGQFYTDAGLPALLRAVSTDRNPKEALVRLGALKALGDLAVNLRGAAGSEPPDSKWVDTLLAASQDHDPPIRDAAANALGAVGDARSIDRLKQMLNDEQIEVRYNAAGALAKHGDASALDTLIEMLDPHQPPPQPPDKQDDTKSQAFSPQQWQELINTMGLQGIVWLAEANPTVELGMATAAIGRLTTSDLPQVRSAALAAQQKLAGRSAPAAARSSP